MLVVVEATSLINIQESEVLHDSRIELTRKLHILEAHLLRYQSLLHNFKTSVCFIQETPNRAMESEAFTEDQRMASNEVMEKESRNLLSEIDRLAKRREMLSNRLKNVMNLAFATVNIEDSRQTRTLTGVGQRFSSYETGILLSSTSVTAPGAYKLLPDLIPDDGLPTSQFSSHEYHGVSYRTYLTPTSLVCLRGERRRDQPFISSDSRSLRRDHNFVHAHHSLRHHHTSDAHFVPRGECQV